MIICTNRTAYLVAFVGGGPFHLTRLPAREWGISLALRFVSIPLGVLIRSHLERTFMKITSPDDVLPTTKPEATEWNEAIARVRGSQPNLRLRGGVNTPLFVLKSLQPIIPK
jgi:P-type Ca2+ transporter type 2C